MAIQQICLRGGRRIQSVEQVALLLSASYLSLLSVPFVRFTFSLKRRLRYNKQSRNLKISCFMYLQHLVHVNSSRYVCKYTFKFILSLYIPIHFVTFGGSGIFDYIIMSSLLHLWLLDSVDINFLFVTFNWSTYYIKSDLKFIAVITYDRSFKLIGN